MSKTDGAQVFAFRGTVGIGTIVVLGLVGYWMGIDPRFLIGGAEMAK